MEKSVQARLGHVDLAQVSGIVVFPFMVLLMALVPSLLLSQTRWAWIGNLWCLLFVLLLFPYLFMYGGGM
ncbi:MULTISPECIES: hypothetical protein [Nitrospirillum]|uniref:hypothetical protein n=1 Tax=Nitrospirillum amazonense TaxID=28077 RepID=UPI00119E7B20|nr:hypothetical protein [Nitrospirillum amazonense]MEC4594861.1 hypothetical protein [Nitrospirillum amazonense]